MHESAPSTSFSMLVCMGVVSMFVAWGLSAGLLHGGCQYPGCMGVVSTLVCMGVVSMMYVHVV